MLVDSLAVVCILLANTNVYRDTFIDTPFCIKIHANSNCYPKQCHATNCHLQSIILDIFLHSSNIPIKLQSLFCIRVLITRICYTVWSCSRSEKTLLSNMSVRALSHLALFDRNLKMCNSCTYFWAIITANCSLGLLGWQPAPLSSDRP